MTDRKKTRKIDSNALSDLLKFNRPITIRPGI